VALSPFLATAKRLDELVSTLDPRPQVLLFCSAARVLLGDRAGDTEDALVATYEFAVTGRVPDGTPRTLAAPAESGDVDTVTLDALICADIALQIAHGEVKAQDAVWYVLEPQFQATSERLFGFTDVGSEREERDEAVALRDPTLARAVDAVETTVAELSAEPTEQQAAMAAEALRPLRP